MFVSGHGPVTIQDGKVSYISGKVGRDLTVEQGYEAAKVVMLNMLQSLKGVIGDLDKVRRMVKLLGFVNCTEDFPDQPKVINGASDLLVELYGERGRHARSAVGMYQLPFGIAVEIEMVVEVEGNWYNEDKCILAIAKSPSDAGPNGIDRGPKATSPGQKRMKTIEPVAMEGVTVQTVLR